jgi:hypothetical protein
MGKTGQVSYNDRRNHALSYFAAFSNNNESVIR